MESPEDMVDKYLQKHQKDLFPLAFGSMDDEQVITEENFTTSINSKCSDSDIVLQILHSMKYFLSIYKYDNGALIYYCNKGRYRSSLDIWRHIKGLEGDYNIERIKTISLMDVMRAIYNITLLKDIPIMGHYCCDISKRVFEKITFTHQERKIFYARFLNTNDVRQDEYGLYFDAWEHIGE